LISVRRHKRHPMARPILAFSLFFLSLGLRAQPVATGILPISELKSGQVGQVWTVFQGTKAEPFSVEVTGVIKNALGPGKSIILCQMTDPRVQNMGAVAGMSGSPLYIDGKFVGALSYQVQRFETVRFAGFTPAVDLEEVESKVGETPAASQVSVSGNRYQSLQPVFNMGGISPVVAELMSPQLAALGISVNALSGNDSGSGSSIGAPSSLKPGEAVSVALTTGDITVAGTGTVSAVDGNRIVAFGHPMLGMGDVELPMCAAEVVTILPSNLESMKVANIGPVIGSISQDRLSAISGTMGAGPQMIDVNVSVERTSSPAKNLHFQVVRQQQLAPALIASGVAQAILGSNDAGLNNGFRISSDVTFSPSEKVDSSLLYAGPQSFMQGISEFVSGLSADLMNPYEKTFPSTVSFSVKPLSENPAVTIEQFQVSRTSPRPGETIEVTLAWRDYQGEDHREEVSIPIDPQWAGKTLEVVAAPGRILDDLTGKSRGIAPAQLRSFGAYIDSLRDDRPTDGICIAVLEHSSQLTDQNLSTTETPGSIERIAHGSDEMRYQRRDASLSLWETHILDGKVVAAVVRRAIQVSDTPLP
jgi:hypothetical protein